MDCFAEFISGRRFALTRWFAMTAVGELLDEREKPVRSRLEQDSGAGGRWCCGALVGMTIPPLSLMATDDTAVTLSALPGRIVVFAYPRTGEPGKIALVDDWDMIPGARGCTPQTCSFRDLFAELKAAGAKHVFGLSTQSNLYQTEMASRLHLPFAVLSDARLELTRALDLPTMEVAGETLIKRLALVIDHARITHVFYPVFRPIETPAMCWHG